MWTSTCLSFCSCYFFEGFLITQRLRMIANIMKPLAAKATAEITTAKSFLPSFDGQQVSPDSGKEQGQKTPCQES